MHEEEKYFALLSLVCRKMPHYAVQMTLDAGEYPDQPRQFLHDVKRGRAINLTALLVLVRHSLPRFEVPAHLLPDAQPEPVTA